MKNDLVAVLDAFRPARSYLVCSHINPDGDAVGSVLALAGLIRAMGHTRVACVLADEVPALYRWLPGADRIKRPEELKTTFDAAVIVDAARRDRIGAASKLLPEAGPLIVVDHHLEEHPEGDVVLLDPTAAAASVLVTELFDAAGIPIPREAATCAYTALVTDTGRFQYSNSDARAHRTAARLIEAGVAVTEIAERVFNLMSRNKFELLRKLVDTVDFLAGGRVAVTTLARTDALALSADSESLDGLTNLARDVEGVEVSVFFRELDETSTKISLRSRASVNSAEVCRKFGGGGHAAAAGATVGLSLAEARSQVLAEVLAQLDKVS